MPTSSKLCARWAKGCLTYQQSAPAWCRSLNRGGLLCTDVFRAPQSPFQNSGSNTDELLYNFLLHVCPRQKWSNTMELTEFQPELFKGESMQVRLGPAAAYQRTALSVYPRPPEMLNSGRSFHIFIWAVGQLTQIGNCTTWCCSKLDTEKGDLMRGPGGRSSLTTLESETATCQKRNLFLFCYTPKEHMLLGFVLVEFGASPRLTWAPVGNWVCGAR